MENENIYVDNQICLHVPSTFYAPELYRVIVFNRKILSEFLPWPDSVTHENDTINFLNTSLLAHQNDEAKTYIILFNNTVVGLISFNEMDKESKTADIGYWLDSRFQGNGIITRSVNALTQYYASKQIINHFIIKCAVQNIKSNHVAKRCGFLYESTIKTNSYLNHDHHVYHLTILDI